MMLQAKARPRAGQGSEYLAGAVTVAVLSLAACSGNERVAEEAQAATVRSELVTQPLSADPCAWLSLDDVGTTLRRTLRGVPVRVSSAESIIPSATGAGCLYELAPERGDVAGTVSIEVKIDGAEMQAGLAASTGGAFAQAKGNWSAAWDWVSGLPAGLFAARQGHVGVLIAINDATLAPMDVEPIAARVMAKVPDVPFANSANDPAIAGSDPNPCTLVTRDEAESVLGTLRFAPYRSHESTPVAHGDGSSCTYYTAGHHVVVLTPSWSDGKTLFGMMRGVAGLTQQVSGERKTASTTGPWDARATGVAAGTQYYLKGDRMLALQHRASQSDDVKATHIARIALSRM